MRIDLFVALARRAQLGLSSAWPSIGSRSQSGPFPRLEIQSGPFDRLGGTSLCCGHMGQGGSCTSACARQSKDR